MTVGMLEDAVKACRISMELYHENPTIVNLGGDSCIDPLLKQLPGMQEATVIHMDFMQPQSLQWMEFTVKQRWTSSSGKTKSKRI